MASGTKDRSAQDDSLASCAGCGGGQEACACLQDAILVVQSSGRLLL